MSPEEIQDILNDFANRAQRIGTRADNAEVWRFDAGPNHYELHFWEEETAAIKKYIGGANAALEFTQLLTLQKLTIPATRVIANLKGFRIGDRRGDACIVVCDQTVTPLNELPATGSIPHRERTLLVARLCVLLESLHRARMCPIPLLIDRFALRGEQFIVHDGAGAMGGLVTAQRLGELDRSTRFITTRTERLRIWKHFTNVKTPRASRRDGAALLRDATLGAGAFGRIAVDEWIGRFTRKLPAIVPWSALNGMVIRESDWTEATPSLVATAVTTDIKIDTSGSVRSARVALAGRMVDVIVKRPAFKPGLRGAVQRFRTSRAMRTWKKTWRMLGLGFRCEVPLLVLEKRSGLRVVDQLIVFERVPGQTLARVELDAMPERERSELLHACGRTLRSIERLRFTHADAKNTNWIAWVDPAGRSHPGR